MVEYQIAYTQNDAHCIWLYDRSPFLSLSPTNMHSPCDKVQPVYTTMYYSLYGRLPLRTTSTNPEAMEYHPPIAPGS